VRRRATPGRRSLWSLAPPNVELALQVALGAALDQDDPAHIREAAGRLLDVTATGRWIACLKSHAKAAVAALDGRIDDAVRAFSAAHDGFTELGLPFEAAMEAVEALTALPDVPDLRARAEAVRPLLEDLRARPWIERLDGALQRASSGGSTTRRSAEVAPTA